MTDVASIGACFDLPQPDGSVVSYVIEAHWAQPAAWSRQHRIAGATLSEAAIDLAGATDAIGPQRRGELLAAHASVIWWLEWRRRQTMADPGSDEPALDAADLEALDNDIGRLSEELLAHVDGDHLEVGARPHDAIRPISTLPFAREPVAGALIAGGQLGDHVGDHNVGAFVAALLDGFWLIQDAQAPRVLGFDVSNADRKRMELTVHLSEMSWADFRHILALVDGAACG